MAKKAMNLLFVIGTALTVIGFCCPMFKGLLGSSANGFQFINFDNSGFVTIGALLIFAGAVAALAAEFVPQISGLKFLFLIASIVGGVILVIGFTTNGGIYKAIGKGFLKHATVGFYLVIVGWVVALAGHFTNK